MERANVPRLLVEQGETESSVIVLNKVPHILGRDTEADTTFDNHYVSRQHAQISEQGGGYRISDLTSSNGTTVNGLKVDREGVVLQDRDRIELAPPNCVRLIFQSSDTTTTVRPPKGTGPDRKRLEVKSQSREVYVGSRLVEPRLSRKEFDVLCFMDERRGAACAKDEIATAGWPERAEMGVSDQEIEQCIRRLRVRLENDPSNPAYISTIRGYGYRLDP